MTPPLLTAFCRHAARAVISGQMDYYDAESSIASFLPSIAYQDYDAAFDLLSKTIARYEQEAGRLERAIRAVIRPMFDRRAPAPDIKKAAEAVNKHEYLAPHEVTEILKSEYAAWKLANQPPRPIGNSTIPALRRQTHAPPSTISGRA